MRFVEHLIHKNEYEDAIYLLHQLQRDTSSYTTGQEDSLNYFLGWSYYLKQSVDTSAYYLKKVSDSFPLYHKCKFYQSFNNSYTGRTKNARHILEQLNFSDTSSLYQLKQFELASISLLRREYDRFERLSQQFDYDYYVISKKQRNLREYYNELKGIKQRSPFLAGLFSGIIPGSGKWYAGNPWKGLSSFITVSTLGAVATENYIRGGPKSGQFIAAASVFTIFYVGNIWGSVLSVKIKRQERYNEIDHQIRLDMHIPLRRAFE